MILRAGQMFLCMIGAALCVTSIMGQALQATGEFAVGQVPFHAQGEGVPVLEDAQDLFARAGWWEPWNPQHALYGGLVFQAAALRTKEGSVQRETLMNRARDAYAEAAALHPLRAEYHVSLAWAEMMIGRSEAGHRAIETALQVYPEWEWIRQQALRWYLARWDELPADERMRVKALVKREAGLYPAGVLQMVWSMVKDPREVREILPPDPAVRKLLLTQLTDRQHVLERWAEQGASAMHDAGVEPSLDAEVAVRVISQGRMSMEQEEALLAVASTKPWEGLVEGWLSGLRAATTEVTLPPGEALLCVSMLGVPADGVWPHVDLKLAGRPIVRWVVSTEEGAYRLWHVLLNTPGETSPSKRQ